MQSWIFNNGLHARLLHSKGTAQSEWRFITSDGWTRIREYYLSCGQIYLTITSYHLRSMSVFDFMLPEARWRCLPCSLANAIGEIGWGGKNRSRDCTRSIAIKIATNVSSRTSPLVTMCQFNDPLLDHYRQKLLLCPFFGSLSASSIWDLLLAAPVSEHFSMGCFDDCKATIAPINNPPALKSPKMSWRCSN